LPARQHTYTEAQKGQALAALQAAGYPDVAGAMTRTAKALQIPERTLRRWARNEHGAPPASIVRAEKATLSDRLELIAGLTLDRIEERVQTPQTAAEVDMRDLVGLAKISIEMRELLEGRATSRDEHDLRGVLIHVDR